MKRIAEEYLKQWFHKKSRMPLIIRGARQVGKSTLVRIFCANNNLDLIEINLEKEKIRSLQGPRLNLQSVLDEIQLKSQKKITDKTLIFFDEIQEQPILLKFLRYFYEEKSDVAVIAAGSLLEVTLKSENFSFPVGRVEFYNLGPMTFKEFLWATNQELLLEKIENLDFSPAVEELAKESLRSFLYVGGMPKSVDTFVKEKSFVSVRAIQDQIIQTYMADFPKYNSKINVERINRVFSSSVIHLGKKLIYQRIDQDSQTRDIKRIVELLFDARVLLPCMHSNANVVPLAGESDPSILKIYFIDVGLMNSLLKLDLEVIDQELKTKFNTKGVMAEQFVAQHLWNMDGHANRPELFYWLRDKGSQKGEIDFVIQKGHKIIPVEVKSQAPGHMKSAFYFAKEKECHELVRVSLNSFEKKVIEHKIDTQNVKINMIELPLYAIEMLMIVI
ncbi:MAG: ATP-binding protein [Bacteriovoracaceae bacterium]